MVAGIVLLLVYVVLSFAMDPEGSLGTDTGGKVATVKVMSERGDLDPDVGYWASEWDPEGDVHGLYYTAHIGDRYVNVTSLPLVLAARPLYDVGGYRAALLLPMLGAWMRLLLGAIERGRPGISRPRPMSGLRTIAAAGFTILFLFFLVTTIRAANDLRDIHAEAPVVGPILEGMVAGVVLWAVYAVAISTLRGEARRRTSERKMGGLLR